MTTTVDIKTAIDAARASAHAAIDKNYDDLLSTLFPKPAQPAGTRIFKDPTDADCADPANKNGHNLTEQGVEILYRLLDKGAGYNSAGRRMAITQTAVRNRKGDWARQGGVNREKRFLPHIDTIA
ncbi:hypothetical protein EN866_19595 [Mesorhizobium sp. M2D.F.Ca.ET.223.01.1.1]|uniref:hypothetical protein n=1 Tax=unclassified Mesorhizobium TaxID=325217 RepID=UPI000FCA4099|nr:MULTISPECIES: hypothetical protein [unclassified Mesorhizobium]TGP89366.1 hypothetical protein EN864_19605 [bacterium M00.F.Ca.ET.221.01.1.1]TGP94739.1 hypothetical protein EN865_15475 [bacterium M00.F.Ca.ET.222.01.1.1]RVD58847.1 hypothetical protein EN783_14520 [Mesorhizobium sp. M2D.F.Ca.ET.140.01.1.1]TGP27875.1 hypothetical protein EN875_033000 [Mesorhizobium sp. M2D.F.Ca.ET.232.01.1.1]TGP75907.1 hypothetical protein EN867_15475 [Mesorhizobium sp. M2D.F.Ca.ET.224.01.1.1]